MTFVLSDYIEHAMAHAEYDKLEDNTFSGQIPACTGVLAFADTLAACQTELRSVLEDWIFVGLKFKHPLPVIDKIDLNKEIVLEPMDTV